ncbi:hypothetical protein [Allomuricauda sp. F6463D]|uniref:hypothetical protein n=1 Tax=Allomuricauda sp. F6463D TaxID=2926409 RepID=UPI001FF24A38|nr:hypothetical protein [Muricauda sp. F6463D]MCK0160667.1 hypothetical protein [Muricauda sp. F6463D]
MSPNISALILTLGCIIITLWARKRIHQSYSKSIWRTTLLLFSFYFLVLTIVEIRWYYFHEYAASFDLNNNGFIDWRETNSESQNAVRKIIDDAPRNFAFLTVGVFSFLVSLLYLLIDVVITFLKIKRTYNT